MLKIIKISLLVGLLNFLCMMANAAENSGTVLLTQLLGRTQTLQAAFTETIADSRGKTLKKASGKMMLVRPGKFRWEVINPTPQLIITNGSRLWIYDPDLEQVTIRRLTGEEGEAPALLLMSSNQTILNRFQIRFIEKPKASYVFFLTPKDKGSLFAVIKLMFSENQINRMVLEDHLGQTTTIEFSGIKVNQGVKAGLFTFTVPRGVDVINE